MQQQYWPQPYAQPYPQQYATAAGAYNYAAAAATPQPTAQPMYAQYAQSPYAQAYQAQQMQHMQQQMQHMMPQQAAAAAYQPGFRTGGGYDHHYNNHSSDYHGSAFDTRSAGAGRSAGRALNSKMKAWNHKVMEYKDKHGISLKDAMIALKGTGTGSRKSRGSRSHSRHGGNW